MSRHPSCRHDSCRHRAYKLTCDEFDDLHVEADGACQICLTVTTDLNIDHDHALGVWAVRGILCSTCNSVLGQAEKGYRNFTHAMVGYLEGAWYRRNPSIFQKIASTRPTGLCRGCGGVYPITKSGKLRLHVRGSLLLALPPGTPRIYCQP